ncbi:MAG: SDR family NAD(P)-dependent oxidoreductase, partial [Limnohabitans sp.]
MNPTLSLNGQALSGQVAAVTGAASGIGLASAQALVSAGATVVLVDRDRQALDKACATLGASALPLVLDLLDPAQCAAMPERILALAGRLDIFHA